MRRIIDCGIIVFSEFQPHVQQWSKKVLDHSDRVRLHPIYFSDQHKQRPEMLRQMSVMLKRYDVCLLPINRQSLSWSRLALACASTHLSTPILGLTLNLKGPAIQDLLALGMQNFISDKTSIEELWPRLFQCMTLRTVKDVAPSSPPPVTQSTHIDAHHLSLKAIRSDQKSFKLAKEVFVEEFEKNYICELLSQYRGNISKAARVAQKNRRAFWELIRKHQIDAQIYKNI